MKEFERLTQEWIKQPTIAEQRRGEVAERLRIGYWKLDPYIRARSLYDRTGVIRNGGQVQHYEDLKNGMKTHTSARNGPLPAQHEPGDLD